MRRWHDEVESATSEETRDLLEEATDRVFRHTVNFLMFQTSAKLGEESRLLHDTLNVPALELSEEVIIGEHVYEEAEGDLITRLQLRLFILDRTLSSKVHFTDYLRNQEDQQRV
jgi:hypothetical protein